jgi:hypothetical protein
MGMVVRWGWWCRIAECPQLQQNGSSDDLPLLLQDHQIVGAWIAARCPRKRSRSAGFRVVTAMSLCCTTCNIRKGVNSHVAQLPTDRSQGDNPSSSADRIQCCPIDHTMALPAVAAYDTNQLKITRSRSRTATLRLADSMRLDGPGRDGACCWLTLVFVSLPPNASVGQRSPTLLKEDQR